MASGAVKRAGVDFSLIQLQQAGRVVEPTVVVVGGGGSGAVFGGSEAASHEITCAAVRVEGATRVNMGHRGRWPHSVAAPALRRPPSLPTHPLTSWSNCQTPSPLPTLRS